MRIVVLHADREALSEVSYGGGESWRARVRKALADGHYVKAAEIETPLTGSDGLEAAFGLTNSVDEIWYMSPKVKATRRSRRSTSLGDLLVVDGIAHAVASIGFDELGPVDINE